jgi:hypothetical protein
MRHYELMVDQSLAPADERKKSKALWLNLERYVEVLIDVRYKVMAVETP